jgi:hypothetical protein
MTRKIKSLLFRVLPNAAHATFCQHVGRWLSEAGEAVLAVLGDLPAQFNAWLAKENAHMVWVRKSFLTEDIAAADRRLNRALVALRTQVRAQEHSHAPDIAEVARLVYIMLKNFGVVYRKPYDEKLGDAGAIHRHLAGDYAADAARLGLTPEVAELQGAITELESLLLERDGQWAGKPAETFTAVRCGIERVYHRIVAKVNAGAELNLSPAFAAFIDLVNGEIAQFNTEFHHARHNVAAATVERIPAQRATGDYITPTPGVRYTLPNGETETLEPGRDFDYIYRNNRRPGNAECTIRGKGRYRGRQTVAFIIEKGADEYRMTMQDV